MRLDEFIEKEIPHISELFCKNAAELVQLSDIIVIVNREEEYTDAIGSLRKDQRVYDLARIVNAKGAIKGEYEGISW